MSSPAQCLTVVVVVVCVFLFQIRMQAQGSLLQGSMMSNFMNIYQTEGTRGLWRVSHGAAVSMSLLLFILVTFPVD